MNPSTSLWAAGASMFASSAPWMTLLRWEIMPAMTASGRFFSLLPRPHLSIMDRTSPVDETFWLAATSLPQLVLPARSKVSRRMISSIESSPGLVSRCVSSRCLPTCSIVVASLTATRLRSSGRVLPSRGPSR